MARVTLTNVRGGPSEPELSPIARMVWKALQGMNLRPNQIINAHQALSLGIKNGLRNGDELVEGLKELHQHGRVSLPEGADNATLTDEGFQALHR